MCLRGRRMTLGTAPRQGDLLDDITRFCDAALGQESIYAFLHRERDRLFPDEFFADLFSDLGRRSVPPSVVATVMVLQRLEGLSDREAVERYTFDARWRYAAGVGGYDGEGRDRFVHTVLVEMRERLRRSERPERVFEVTRDTAAAAGLVGRRRVLDSTPLYDAVATMDTITLIRSAMRGLLAVAGEELEARLRAVCTSGDDYASSAKPQIDWEDRAAREALIDTRARDAHACLALLHGREMGPALTQAAQLLAAVVGQDLETTEDGTFRIARRVAPDRIASTVDPEARHGHKTQARSFDGYKGHVAIDPDHEIITASAVTAGNVGDAEVVETLLADCLVAEGAEATAADGSDPDREPTEVYGDCADGTGKVLERRSRCSRRRPRQAISPRSSSPSTSAAGLSPAPTRSRWRSGPSRTGAASQPSTPPAASARWSCSAPAHRRAGSSPSAPTRPSWPPRGNVRKTRAGVSATAPPGPRWSASSGT